ncbi:MAG: cyclic nucleotide-binding domain-containing protein [Rickettsiales bacterium]
MPNTNIKKGGIIFREGDEPDGVYYLCEGRVRVTKNVAGQEITLAEMEPGDIFGELAMVGESPRSATVTALEDCWVYKFSPESFKKKLQSMDSFMYTMLIALVLTIRNQNRKISELLEMLRNNQN